MVHVRGEKGFSLVELMVALFILAVGLLATATVLTSGMSSNRRAQSITIESTIAYSVLDEIMARDPDDTIFDTDQTDVVYDLDPDTSATTRTVHGVTYSAQLDIDANNPVSGVARIDVTVSGGGRSITLTTFRRTI